jgi:hypothetical protein
MNMPTIETMAEGLILHGLGKHLLDRSGVVTRLGREDLFNEGEADDVGPADWNAAIERLIDSGRILTYKITDLPETLPLRFPGQTGYCTREHMLGLLKDARPDQVEEIRDFLEYQGIEIPASQTRVPLTAAQKKRIDNAVRKLNEIRAEVADRNPDNQVGWYLDANKNLHLMVEPDGQMEPDQQYIAHQTKLWAAGGGDW